MASRQQTFRGEKDTLGEVRVPKNALYGAQTQRAVENYPVSGLRSHPAFIRAFILLKKAAALANFELGEMDRKLAEAISDACDQILGDSPIASRVTYQRGEEIPDTTRSRLTTKRKARRRTTPYISDDYRGQFVVDVFQAGAGHLLQHELQRGHRQPRQS